MMQLLTKIPKYQVARAFKTTPPLPINYTLALTFRCQAQCKTCHIHEREPVAEMTKEEWRLVFEGLGESPYWVTFTGGEPFLYQDISRGILRPGKHLQACHRKYPN